MKPASSLAGNETAADKIERLFSAFDRLHIGHLFEQLRRRHFAGDLSTSKRARRAGQPRSDRLSASGFGFKRTRTPVAGVDRFDGAPQGELPQHTSPHEIAWAILPQCRMSESGPSRSSGSEFAATYIAGDQR